MLIPIRPWVKKIEKLFFVPQCVVCKKQGEKICTRCYDNLHFSPKSHKLEKKFSVFSFGQYSEPDLQKIIKAMKYRFSPDLFKIIQPYLKQLFPQKDIDKNAVFVPVPLHLFKQNFRGFNQCQILAEIFSEVSWNKNQVIPLVKRIRNTPPQSKKQKQEREENVKNAFLINKKQIKKLGDKKPSIVLIDDVLSTGSTLQEIKKVLLDAGFTDISAVVLCRGGK